MPTPTFRASDTGVGQDTGSVTVTIPASTVVGDLLLLSVSSVSGSAPATPSGWTLAEFVVTSAGSPFNSLSTYWKIAGAGDAGTNVTVSPAPGATSVHAAAVTVWAGGLGIKTSAAKAETTFGDTIVAPAVSAAGTSLRTITVWGGAATAGVTPSNTERVDVSANGLVAGYTVCLGVSDDTDALSTTRSATFGGSANDRTAHTIVIYGNVAPNAPTDLSPDGVSINRDVTQRFSWVPSDPDDGDSQSKYDLRFRVAGTSTWTTVSASTPNAYHDFTAPIAADDYEWQVRTYDALGLVGPYSASAFFTAASVPNVPTITDPINNGTIDTDPYTVTWSTPDQDAYQVRTVADDGAGSPDTATVYTDTGTVASTSARSASVAFGTDGRVEHVQVRTQYDGLWSGWASVKVTVSYTSPATPTVTVDEDNPVGAISVQGAHPTPSGGQPTIAYVDVWRRRLLYDADGNFTGYADTAEDPGGEDGFRIATEVAAVGIFTDWYVGSGSEYAYRIQAWGSNGVSSYSDWSEDGTGVVTPDYFGGFV